MPGFGMNRYVFSTRISGLGPATETKSDRSEFIVRPVSCKRIKRNVWRPIRTLAGLSSSRSPVKYPPTSCTIDLKRPWTKAFFSPLHGREPVVLQPSQQF